MPIKWPTTIGIDIDIDNDIDIKITLEEIIESYENTPDTKK